MPHPEAPSGAASATPDKPSLRVTVLCGGPSNERDVSLESGQAVAAALRQAGHEVYVSDIGPDQLDALDRPADVIFPALHGTFGEDGTVQRLMEERGLRFVGSGSTASALAMDKVATKRLAIDAGIDTAPFEVWDALTLAQRQETALGLPAVVKPVAEGSSVGTHVVHAADAFLPAVRDAIGTGGRALVEKFIRGDELTVGIIGDRMLPPICVRPKRGFYDFTAKYEDNETEYLFEAGHPAELLTRVAELSLRVFKLLDCRHLSRVDWIADEDQRLWLLEVNTLPGFTRHSLVPKAAARIGIPFDQLVDRLVRMALEDAS